ncbi:hypothetical protein [Rhizobium sp. CSW-27]|uniref:hypothetical protein n=1 Tax=Rhizobium sp. CSW-27 TaxID=2839985 RepID=UPI001C030996|nr:hypothetical protein [Rhizobium sp. CSW-27]MBT9373450.1 hypothetical protein [Rhizobium sp. CSW-27]
MTKTLIGLDYEGVGCVKITKGSLDPAATPDSEVAAFYYNSKWSKDVNVNLFVNPDKFTSNFIEGGTSYADATHIGFLPLFSTTNFNYNYYRKSYFPGLAYNMPLMDYKPIDYATGRFQTNRVIQSLVGYERRGGLWSTRNLSWYSNAYFTNISPSVTLEHGVFFQSLFEVPEGSSFGERASILVWNLPGDSSPIIDGTPLAPVSGQRQIEINAAACRVSKPGYDVRTATSTQLAFDSSKRPPKIIAANDILIPVGYSEYDTGLELPPGCVIDAAFYPEGATVYYPCNPQNVEFGAEHWIAGSKIAFNANAACRARFIVVSPPAATQTAGQNNVLRQFEQAGRNVVQFLRPGAGEDPSFGDIILDSRWPCLQMIAEGYIPVGNGELQHPIATNSDGLFPIVKFMTVHGSGGSTKPVLPTSWGAEVRSPKVARSAVYRVGWTNVITSGDTCFCTVTSSEVRFFTFRGNPIGQRYANGGAVDNNRITYEYDPAPIVGIRYFVFGVPAE